MEPFVAVNMTLVTLASSNRTISVPGYSKAVRNELIASYIVKFLLDFIGGITNAALIVVLLYQRIHGSSGVKWLIIQYSFCYFLISFIIYPIRDAMILGTHFNLDVPMASTCAHWATVNTVVLAAANWTDVCLAINRLVAICFPHGYEVLKRRSTVVGFMVFSWAFSCVTILSGTYGWTASKAAPSVCSNIKGGGASAFLSAFESFISYSIVGVISMAILVKAAVMARRKRRVSDLNASEAKQMRVHKRRMKVAVMLIASFVWNCTCNFPFMILTMGVPRLFKDNVTLSLWLRSVRGLQYCVSPIIFFLFSDEYRRIGGVLLRRVRGLSPLSPISNDTHLERNASFLASSNGRNTRKDAEEHS